MRAKAVVRFFIPEAGFVGEMVLDERPDLGEECHQDMRETLEKCFHLILLLAFKPADSLGTIRRRCLVPWQCSTPDHCS